MEYKTLKIAVISDLHCHPEKKVYSENNTHLYSDKLRVPSKEHPVESLLEIISESKIRVDLVLSPGDFTDHSDKQGFLSGWSYVTEIARALDSKDIIATIGNHDIDSRHEHSNYSFDIPKKIKQKFPLEPKRLSTFWDKGYAFIEQSDFQILVVNSTHFHTHYDKDNPIANPAIKGKVDKGQIEEIENYLTSNNIDNKIKIALCHHHPINHSRFNLGEHDFLENGEELLAVLGKFKYDLFIHGHKHDPWLRYHNTNAGYLLPILSSGSFSATNQISWNSKFNYFHIIEFTKKRNEASKGTIQTWTFKNQIGWEKNRDDGFYPYTGFGFLDKIDIIVSKVKNILPKDKILKWETIVRMIPEIENLTPEKMDDLEALLKHEKIIINSKIGVRPQHIYYENY